MVHMLKDLKALGVLGLLLFVCMFVAALTYQGQGGAAASYLFNSNSSYTTPSFTAPKVNSSSYSFPSGGSTFSKGSTKSSDRLFQGSVNRAYTNTTPTPTKIKK